MERSNGNWSNCVGSVYPSVNYEWHSQEPKGSTSDHYHVAGSGPPAKQDSFFGATVLSSRTHGSELQRTPSGSSVDQPLQGLKMLRAVSCNGSPQRENSACAGLKPLEGPLDITCFVHTKSSAPGPNTPKVNRMECLLMSPTRRTAKKTQMGQWDYGYSSILVPNDTKGGMRMDVTPTSSSPGGSADKAAVAMGTLHVGTPVALLCGQLMDFKDAS